MKQLWLTAKLDIVESLRARWFQIYTLVFGGIVALLFMFGLTESRVLGFIGLSRLLVTYIQLTMAILPIFVLITTVRSVAGDREAGELRTHRDGHGIAYLRLELVEAGVPLAMNGGPVTVGWPGYLETDV